MGSALALWPPAQWYSLYFRRGMMKKEFLKLNRKPTSQNKFPERSSKRSLPALSLVEVSLSKGRTAEVSLPKGVAIGILAAILLTACSDIGERNNINDYDGDNYAYGDDLYYLNRDGDGFDGEIRLGQATGVHYIYDNGWRKASNLEKDTYDYSENEPWGAGEKGELRNGAIFSTTLYTFDGSWRLATDLEKDTYNYEKNKPWAAGKNGEIRAGVISSTLYIFDGSWRIATDLDKDTYNYEKNKPWAAGKNGEIRAGELSSTLYIFDGFWRIATDFEMDTYNYEKNKPWAAGKDGDSKWGAINTTYCYVFEDSTWRLGNESDCSLKLRGCTALRQNTIEKRKDDPKWGMNNYNKWVICDSKTWRAATQFEADVYDYEKNKPWATGKDGEIRTGAITSTLYTFDGSWRIATDLEKDTYNYEKNKPWAAGKDGSSKWGAINSNICYVFEDSTWRLGNKSDCSLGLGGCTALRQNTVLKRQDNPTWGKSNNNPWAICDSKIWRNATQLEIDLYKDTNKQECSEFGQIVHGIVNTDYAYFCYGNEWKRFYGNESVSYGKLVDERDGRIYRTVKIGEQTWIAENLNYADSINYPSMLNRNWCYNNNLDSCEKYGRHYTWSATIDSVYWKKKGKNCGFKEQTCDLPNQVRGICPTGWHIPSSKEWETLYSSMGASHKAMQAKNFPEWTKAIDEYGFSALPVGYYSGSFQGVGSRVYFWSATEHSTNYAYYWYLGESNALLGEGNNAFGFSVRCIKDEE